MKEDKMTGGAIVLAFIFAFIIGVFIGVPEPNETDALHCLKYAENLETCRDLLTPNDTV